MFHESITFSTGVNPPQGLSLADGWKLWNYRNHDRSVAYMTGAQAIFPLIQVWQTRMALAGIRTHTIDCAIRFNTYAIAEEALRQNVAPETIHDHITVTRAFTPYQILDAVQELKRNEVVFVLAPAKQFFDGDVAFDEGLFLIQKLVRFFADAHERGVALFVVERPSYAAPAFSTFLSDIRALTERSQWELCRIGEKDFRLKHLRYGRVSREIITTPVPKVVEMRNVRIPVVPPRTAQMEFAFT